MSDNRFMRACMVLAAVTLLLAGRTALGDACDDIVQYDWSQSRLPLATIEQEIRDAATPQARLAIEAKLLKALVPGKDAGYELRHLRVQAVRVPHVA